MHINSYAKTAPGVFSETAVFSVGQESFLHDTDREPFLHYENEDWMSPFPHNAKNTSDRPDMTFAVDWASKPNDLPIRSVSRSECL